MIFVPSALFGQTKELEEEYIMKQHYQREITDVELTYQVNKWRKLLDDFGGYPDLPFREDTKELDYTMVFSFEGLSKEVIYNRIMEWAAISFGNINQVMHYSDLLTGKIVLKGHFNFLYRDDDESFWGKLKEDVEAARCYQTWVFTIVEGSLKIETFNVRYEILVYYASPYASSRTISKNIEDMYPITRADPIEWKGRLSILQTTSVEFAKIYASLKEYITDYYDDYNFKDN